MFFHCIVVIVIIGIQGSIHMILPSCRRVLKTLGVCQQPELVYWCRAVVHYELSFVSHGCAMMSARVGEGRHVSWGAALCAFDSYY